MLRFATLLTLGFAVPFAYSIAPDNVTVVSHDFKGFQPLYLGDKADYYVSKNPATVEEANEVCQCIGESFHLVTFENDLEYRKLLPYLRSLEIQKLWTSGKKANCNSTTSAYEWTSPFPGFTMNYTNFPTSSMLSKLTLLYSQRQIEERKKRGSKCKNLKAPTGKCSAGNCTVTLEPCQTYTPPCSIINQKECSSERPECGASCNNCTITPPVCHVEQDPCTVETEHCTIVKPNCTISTPDCVTIRDPCIPYHPPCQVTTPGPCTTTRRNCGTTQAACTTTTPSCSSEKCPAVTFCKEIFKCEEPIVCQPEAIICPSPEYICPPERTICQQPVLNCGPPTIDCPKPVATCPKPRVVCTPAQVTCAAPEINCPGLVVNCPSPSYHCPSPITNCPAPIIECEPNIPCATNPTTTTTTNNPCDELDEKEVTDDVAEDCDDCLPQGCIALRKDTDFKWTLENCSEKLHFICEG